MDALMSFSGVLLSNKAMIYVAYAGTFDTPAAASESLLVHQHVASRASVAGSQET